MWRGRPLLLLGAGRRLDAFAERVRAASRAALVGAGVLAAAVAAAALVAAELPSRMPEAVAAPIVTGRVPQVTVERSEGLATMDEATARRIAASLVADLSRSAGALRERDRAKAREGATGTWLADLWQRIDAARGATIEVPTYDAAHVRLSLEPGTGQGPPVVVVTLTGTTQAATYGPAGGTPVRRGRPEQVVRTFELASTDGRYLVSAIRGTPAAAPTATTEQASFSLKDVAASVGLDFRQGSFRYGTDSGDVTAMMGGGLCWLDYDGDGWLDLYVVNSYSQADAARWNAAGGLPQSRLYHNVHGRFEDVTAKTHTGLTLRGSGCVAADFDGNGTTDLLVTAAAYDPQRNAYDALLWNNGDGTFTEDAKAAGIDQPGWHTGAAAADVNGDGRLDLFVAGYTDVNHPIPGSEAGFPADHGAVRDLLYLNEGGKGEHPRFREVGRAAGLEPHGLDHGLGAVFTDVNGDGRPDLYVANDLDPNRLYVNEPASGALGFRFVEEGRKQHVDDPNAGMGIAVGDYSGDGLQDLFVTNSRGQLHAAYRARARLPYADARPDFVGALGQQYTGWGASWADLDLDGSPELAIANGAIPVTSLAKDAQRIRVVTTDGGTIRALDTGPSEPRNGRGLAVADFDNDGDARPRGQLGRRRATAVPQRRRDGALARGRRARAGHGRHRDPARRPSPRARDPRRLELPLVGGSPGGLRARRGDTRAQARRAAAGRRHADAAGRRSRQAGDG